MPDLPKRFCCEDELGQIGYDGRDAPEDLERWRRSGLRPTTQEMIEALVAEKVEGATLMDVGAGVGMVHIGLLEAGVARVVDVDASRQYLDAARAEAARRGLQERVEYRFGDIVELAQDLPAADVVTADKVICCYPFLPEFVEAVVSVQPRLIGLVYPSDAWWRWAMMAIHNVIWIMFRRPDRWFFHSRGVVDGLMRAAGFEPVYRGGTRLWQVVVFRRLARQG